MRIPAAKAAVDKEWEKLEKISAWNLTKVRSKSEVIDEARTKGTKVHFASLMDICHLKNAELEAKHQKYKGRVVLRGDIVKDDSGVLCSIHWTRIISITNDSSNSRGYHFQTARVRRTSSWRSICLYPGKKSRMHPSCWKFQNRNVQTFGFVYHDTKWPKSWSSMEDPVVPLDRNLYGHLLAGLVWERQFEKVLLEYGWEKSFQLGMRLRTPWKRIILVSVCGRYKIGWKETEHRSDVEST